MSGLSVTARRSSLPFGAMRRAALIGVLFFCCASPAAAGVLTHSGAPVLSGSKSFARLQAYPRTLVELDRSRVAETAPLLRHVGGQELDPSLGIWRLPSWEAERLLPKLERRGLVRSVMPDVPVGTDPGNASGIFGQFSDPLSSTEWWPSHIGAANWTAPGPGVPLTMIDTGVDLRSEERRVGRERRAR